MSWGDLLYPPYCWVLLVFAFVVYEWAKSAD